MRLTIAALIACIFATASLAQPASGRPLLTRNPSGFALEWRDLQFNAKGGWTGHANFRLSACPGQSCFEISGPIWLAEGPKGAEGFFPVAGSTCLIRFEEKLHGGMDSFDYRLTLVGRKGDRKSCGSLPARLNGVYRQPNALSDHRITTPRQAIAAACARLSRGRSVSTTRRFVRATSG